MLKKVVQSSGLALSVALWSPAFAQSTPPASSESASKADSDAPSPDADIVVTAQKRSERLIEVPQSISVLSSDQLNKLGATQFADFANTVPGISFSTTGAGRTQINIRGVTSGNDISPLVGVYVDDVPYGASNAFTQAGQNFVDVGVFDLDRVEVLRGPQGTLYGAAAMGGLIRYVTRRPNTKAFGADVRAGLSSTRDGGINYNASASVNVPLVTDRLAVRASGFESHQGGYIDNVQLGRNNVDASDTYGGRLDLLFTPTEALSIRITGLLQNVNRDGVQTADYRFNGTPFDGKLDQRRFSPEFFNQQFRVISGTIEYDLGPATLTSITGYQTTRTQLGADATTLYVPLLASLGTFGTVRVDQSLATNKFTQEVRLASPTGGFVEWLVGGWYTNEKNGNIQVLSPFLPNGSPATIDVLHLNFPTKYEDYAAFADVTLNLSEKFDVTGGIRLSRNYQTVTQIGTGVLGVSRPTRRSEEGVATYLANARYHFSDRATAYFRFATGYRPGGPNVVGNDPSGAPLGPLTFNSDQLKSYELGFKAETPDRRFGIDIATYYIDWSNMQVVGVRLGQSVRANAGAASVRGAEATLTARPAPGLDLSAALAYTDAHLDEDFPDLRGVKGERLPNIPRFTLALNGDYRFTDSPVAPTIGATVRRISTRYASFNASTSLPQYRLPAYTSVDLRAGFSIAPLDVQFYVRNLFDGRGQYSEAAFGAVAQVAMQQPRTIGVVLSSRF